MGPPPKGGKKGHHPGKGKGKPERWDGAGARLAPTATYHAREQQQRPASAAPPVAGVPWPVSRRAAAPAAAPRAGWSGGAPGGAASHAADRNARLQQLAVYRVRVEDFRERDGHVQFLLEVSQHGSASWRVWRRFSELWELHERLCAGVASPEILPRPPPKGWLPSGVQTKLLGRDQTFYRQRMHDMQVYLDALLGAGNGVATHVIVKRFLGVGGDGAEVEAPSALEATVTGSRPAAPQHHMLDGGRGASGWPLAASAAAGAASDEGAAWRAANSQQPPHLHYGHSQLQHQQQWAQHQQHQWPQQPLDLRSLEQAAWTQPQPAQAAAASASRGPARQAPQQLPGPMPPRPLESPLAAGLMQQQAAAPPARSPSSPSSTGRTAEAPSHATSGAAAALASPPTAAAADTGPGAGAVVVWSSGDFSQMAPQAAAVDPAASAMEAPGEPPGNDDDLGESCAICLSAPKTHAFVPCGHQCVCKECCVEVVNRPGPVKCPVCRRSVMAALQIFR